MKSDSQALSGPRSNFRICLSNHTTILASQIYSEYTPWLYTLQFFSFSKMDIREVFAINLKKARRAKGVSQEELAHRADIDRTYVSLLERRMYSATIDVVAKLADALEVEPDALLKRPAKNQR